jgi:glycosyltransferase involved in cell wall biosynthesis
LLALNNNDNSLSILATLNNVLIVTPIFPPITGGAARYFHNVVSSPLNRRYNYFVLTIGGIPSKKDPVLIYRLPFFISLRSRYSKVSFILVAFVAFFYTLWIIYRRDIKLVQAYSSGGLCLGSALAAKLANVPIVKTVHDTGSSRINLAMWHTTLYCCLKGSCYDYLIGCGVNPDRIIETRLLYNKQFFDSSVQCSPRSEILYVGDCLPSKGLGLLLSAFRELSFSLTLIGDHFDWIKRSFPTGANLGLKILGPLSVEEVANHISAARCVVIPSLREGIPRIMIEALDLGTPAIINSQANFTPYVEHLNGVFLSDFSASSLAELLENSGIDKSFSSFHEDLTVGVAEYTELVDQIFKKCLSGKSQGGRVNLRA